MTSYPDLFFLESNRSALLNSVYETLLPLSSGVTLSDEHAAYFDDLVDSFRVGLEAGIDIAFPVWGSQRRAEALSMIRSEARLQSGNLPAQCFHEGRVAGFRWAVRADADLRTAISHEAEEIALSHGLARYQAPLKELELELMKSDEIAALALELNILSGDNELGWGN